MNKAVIGILLLLISGLAGAFVYIRKLRAKTAESTRKLQAATSQVTSLQSDVKEKEAEARASSEELEQEKKAKKAELMRISAERKAEKARRDALEKMKNAKIAELSAKQKSQEAKLAKTDAQRKAALREANAQRARANAERNKAKRAIADARRSKQLADRARRVADQRARRAGIEISRAKSQRARAAKDAAMARRRVAKAAKDVARARAQVRGVNIKRTFEDAARYGAIPGYYRKGHVWAGNQFKVSDPNVCKALARKKRLAVWGHRNNLHPNNKYKNSCYFYKSGPKYAGNGNDRIHMIGCTYGGNPRTGCVQPKSIGAALRRIGKARSGRLVFSKWGKYWKGIDFPGNDIWVEKGRGRGKRNRRRALARCRGDNRCAALTCNNSGNYCWGKSKLGRSRRHRDRNTWRADRIWKKRSFH